MTVLEILKIIAAIGTIATGLFSLVRPRAIFGFTGLSAPGPRGITEIRAVLGGCPGRIFPSVKQLGHMMVSQLRATGSRDASRPRLGER
jgi:hypothetical protein